MIFFQLIRHTVRCGIYLLLLSCTLTASAECCFRDTTTHVSPSCLLDSCLLNGSSRVAVKLPESNNEDYHRLVDLNAAVSIKPPQAKHLDFELVYEKLKLNAPVNFLSCH